MCEDSPLVVVPQRLMLWWCVCVCRAFATVETIASRYAIQTGYLLELSAQQLISCDVGDELSGCKGGALLSAFKSTLKVGTKWSL